MKYSGLLVVIAITIGIYQNLFGQTCGVNEKGQFEYYVVLKDTIDKNYNKASLLRQITKQKLNGKEQIGLNKDNLVSVSKPFPKAKTESLRRTIKIILSKEYSEDFLKENIEGASYIKRRCFLEDKLIAHIPNDMYLKGGVDLQLEFINAPEAWGITKGDSNIIIGISDTQIKGDHEDIAGNLISILNNNSYTNSLLRNHGTSVAGCASGVTNNSLGVASIGYNSSLIFNGDWADDSVVFEMAMLPNVRVINCSWINSCDYDTIQAALYKEIRDSLNVVVVAGAGNTDAHCGSKIPIQVWA